jgi:ABC-2 type transport system permease protein
LSAATVAARPRFFGAVRGETIKLSRQLSVWLMLGGAFLLLAVVVLAITGAPNFKSSLESNPTAWAYNQLNGFGTIFQIGSGIFLLIIGSRLFGMEYSSGTIRVIYARGLGRLQLLLAKAVILLLIGLVLLLGYCLVLLAILALIVNAVHGNLDPVQSISSGFWQDVERWAVVQGASACLAILIAAAAAGIGRSLAFAVAAALTWYPMDNFLTILEGLGLRVTRQEHPWADISAYQLAPNLNVLLTLWSPGHRVLPVLGQPIESVDLTHAVIVVAVFAVGFAAVAVVRAVRPDVLE